MKQETQKARVKEVGQSHQVTIVLKLRSNKDMTITRERAILTPVMSQQPDGDSKVITEEFYPNLLLSLMFDIILPSLFHTTSTK